MARGLLVHTLDYIRFVLLFGLVITESKGRAPAWHTVRQQWRPVHDCHSELYYYRTMRGPAEPSQSTSQSCAYMLRSSGHGATAPSTHLDYRVYASSASVDSARISSRRFLCGGNGTLSVRLVQDDQEPIAVDPLAAVICILGIN